VSPTLRHAGAPDAHLDLDVLHVTATPRRVRVYACALLALALAALVVAGVVDGVWPTPGVLLLFAVPLGLCMNRFVFFPNEVGVTADAAVVLAAIVVFHDGAAWTGPILLALLAGPLDARHWESRAFVRMAYNSGSSALVTLLAVAVFTPVVAALGGSPGALLVAAVVAALPYVAAESTFGVTLVVLLGESPATALRHQLPLNAIALPLAGYGALAALAGVELGLGWTLVLLLPVPLVPELLLVRVPRRLSAARVPGAVAAAGVLVGIGLVVTGAVVVDASPLLVVAIAALAAFAGWESRIDAEHAVPLLAVAVSALVVALVPVDAALAVGGVAVITAGVAARHASAGVATRALLGALVAGLVVAGGVAVGLEALVGIVLAGATAVLVVTRRPSLVVWSGPLLAVAAALGAAARPLDRSGALVASVAGVVALAVIVTGGVPVWRSRRLASLVPATGRVPRVAVAATALAALAATATVWTVDDHRTAWACAAVAIAETDLAIVLALVRQWRFAPRRRARDATAVALTGVGVLLAAPGLADRAPWAAAVVAVAVAVTMLVARPLLRAATPGTRRT
jgi:hypothetical protein